MELETLKNTPKLRHIVSKVIALLLEHKEHITFLRRNGEHTPYTDIVDNYILDEIETARDIADPILVTNDRILQLQASLKNIKSERIAGLQALRERVPALHRFVEDPETAPPNAFVWREGKPVLLAPGGDKTIGYTNDIWNLKPRTVYQNLALELINAPHVDLVSIQSEAGFGKTYLALAAALYQVLERKGLRQGLRGQAHHRDRGQARLPAGRHRREDGALREVHLRPHPEAPPPAAGQQAVPESRRGDLRA